MIYFIINNDFHIDNLKNYYSINQENVVVVIIPYNFTKNVENISSKQIFIQTPFRESIKFWNPYNFYQAKKKIDYINFSKTDHIILQTEYDPLNQYIVYCAKTAGAKISLFEEGIATYYTFIKESNAKLTLYEKIKLFYLQNIIGFKFVKFLKLGNKLFLQMEDSYIDEVLLYFDITIKRAIEKKIIYSNKFIQNNLDTNNAIFLNQPLYESYLSIDTYIKNIVKILIKLLKKHEVLYFKFHPRDKGIMKKVLINHLISSNVVFIDNLDLIESIERYKPMYAYSVFSDSLFKLYHYGLTCVFLYLEITELHYDEVLNNVDEVLKSIKSNKMLTGIIE